VDTAVERGAVAYPGVGSCWSALADGLRVARVVFPH